MAESWSKEHTCRICLKKFDELNSLKLFSEYFLVDGILAVNRTLNQHADLPDMCCVLCLEELKVCHDFKLKCESSNEILIKYYDKLPALLINLQLVNLEDKIDATTVQLNSEYFDNNEPVIDYKKAFTAKVKCFKKHKFKTLYNSIEKTKKVHLDATLEKKLKTLSVKEIDENKIIPTQVSYNFKKGISNVGIKCCHICNYIAPYPSALSRHLRTHTKERPYSCEACSKTFSDISTLNKHKHSHSDDPQYVCDVCGKQFTFRTSLVKHLATHSEEKFECGTCKKMFNSKFNLNSHARRHMKDGLFVCEICGKKRVSKYNLDIHKRVHSGEQQFPCKECSYKTVSKAGLLIHERTHSGEKPFPCMECDEKFISGLQLTRHLIKKHRKHKVKLE